MENNETVEGKKTKVKRMWPEPVQKQDIEDYVEACKMMRHYLSQGTDYCRAAVGPWSISYDATARRVK